MTDPVIRVVAAVVEREGRYLLGLRPADKRHGGLWEFPGGKLDPGETWLDGARRELDEELGVVCVEVGPAAWSSRDPGSPYEIHFMPARIEGSPSAVEHDAVGWFGLDELAAMPLAPADAAFVGRLSDAASSLDPAWSSLAREFISPAVVPDGGAPRSGPGPSSGPGESPGA